MPRRPEEFLFKTPSPPLETGKMSSSVKKSLSEALLRHVKRGWASWVSFYKTLAGSGF
jgi:hypothetical protein